MKFSKSILPAALMGLTFFAAVASANSIYLGNALTTRNNGADGSPPLVILGQFTSDASNNPTGPGPTSVFTIPATAKSIDDVQLYAGGGNWSFNLYVVQPGATDSNGNQEFTFVSGEHFSGSGSGVQLLPAAGLTFAPGDLIAFAGTGPVYANGLSSPNGHDATYSDASAGGYTATAPVVGHTYSFGLNGSGTADYAEVPPTGSGQSSRIYSIGVDITTVPEPTGICLFLIGGLMIMGWSASRRAVRRLRCRG